MEVQTYEAVEPETGEHAAPVEVCSADPLNSGYREGA